MTKVYKSQKYLPTGSTDKTRLYTAEGIIYAVLLVILLIGIVGWFISESWFENVYVREDGFVEDLTIVPLGIAVVVSAGYLKKLGRYRSWIFSACMVLVLVFSVFIAGEEISWGQRIFNWKSSGYFMANNAQQETNLHNLVVNGEKVNRIIFSRLLTILIALYLFVLPFLHGKSQFIRRAVDFAGIPVPRNAQIIAAVVMAALIGIIQNPKNSELFELGITMVFLPIFIYPRNGYVFKRNTRALA